MPSTPPWMNLLFRGLIGAGLVVAWVGSVQGRLPVFERDVLPLLTAHCLKCHGGDGKKGGLDLRSPAAMLEGGDNGPAVVKGKADGSLLIQQIATKKMPPGKATKLTAEEVEKVRDWIDAGLPARLATATPDGRPWSFQPVARLVPPGVKQTDRVRTPIDAFLLARLEQDDLTFAPDADPITLIRRLTFDLTGLPPTPEEIDRFTDESLANPRVAYEALVDRLLASPHYGERWGRHWLDLARFSESQGYERDKPRDHAWPYRDYVIRSFNEDKPYPQFVREQIAGDVLEPITPDGLAASAFLVCGPWDEVGQTQQGALMRLRVREEELEDLIAVVSQTFLGLTVNCARCHDHKFDPITQTDYYRFKAAFDGVRPGERPTLTPGQLMKHEAFLNALQLKAARAEKEADDLVREGRGLVQRKERQQPAQGLPTPRARWAFEGDTRDAIGGLHGTLQGGAAVVNGRLKLDGKGAFLRTEPLEGTLSEKTLEAWVSLANLRQQGGGVLTVEMPGGKVFDSVVFGEREPGKWFAGSDFFRRTRDLKGPAETSKPEALVHVAAVYAADDSITFYRNGALYGSSYTPNGLDSSLRAFAAKEARVVMGLRHTGAGNGFLAGEIEEARLYDRALSAAEVRASYQAGPEAIPVAQALAALTSEQRQRHAALLEEARSLRDKGTGLAAQGRVYAVNPKQPDPTFILLRGDVEKKGPAVTAGGLAAIKAPSPDFDLTADAPEGQRRVKLADWIASADNPLTARVMVNRLWHFHFGQGLVNTPSDFGTLGDPPSHPELLDWLASEFVRGNGSVKRLHRLMLLSTAYRQGSRFDAKAAAGDADNRLLWRFTPRRLEGEAIRDAMLAAAGRLNRQVGGPSFRPFTVTVFNSTFYTLTDPEGADYNRRTVYRMNVNSAKSPLLDGLDCPDPSVKAPRRAATTTPLQALALMNNVFVHRQAAVLADVIRRDPGGDFRSQVERAYLVTLGRVPTRSESERAVAVAGDHGLETVCWALFNSSEFLFLR